MFDKIGLEKAILEMGNSPISSVLTWDKELTEEVLLELVEESSNLILIEDVVTFIKGESKEENSSFLLKQNLTYDEVVSIIDKYNDQVEKEYQEINPNALRSKIRAIEKFLKSKYEIEKIEVENLNNIYLLKYKETERGYAIIVEILNEEVSETIETLFADTSVDIYVINEIVHQIDDIHYRFKVLSPKKTEVVVKENLEKFKLDKMEQLLYKISKEDGE